MNLFFKINYTKKLLITGLLASIISGNVFSKSLAIQDPKKVTSITNAIYEVSTSNKDMLPRNYLLGKIASKTYKIPII